jgi:hypothetical protein
MYNFLYFDDLGDIIMPLSFSSISHVKIAFGFFNIETDMLLLDNYFFFADDFCRHISNIALNNQDNKAKTIISYWDIYKIEKNEDIGNLMNAIYGISYTGFIGEVYRHFPFPQDAHLFKQNPLGFKNRELIKNIIEKYAHKDKILFSIDKETNQVKIGDYTFDNENFLELIKYVIKGGYPKWKDAKKPDYVDKMETDIKKSFIFS